MTSGDGSSDPGWPGSTRRDRLERIAEAERDRRRGRASLALATIGEASEWPARAVVALARLEASEVGPAREILEDGLDRWAQELGLGPLDSGGPEPALPSREWPEEGERDELVDERMGGPLDPSELDRAFEQAEAQTDEMHDVNQVAARVLMGEPIGLAEVSEMAGDMDAAYVAEPVALAHDRSAAGDRGGDAGRPSQALVLATLERWLESLQRRRAGRI